MSGIYLIYYQQTTGDNVFQKRFKNALRGKNSAQANFPQPSKILEI